MLVEFSVENFKSFKDRVTLSMVAAKIKSEDPTLDEDAVIPTKFDHNLLRCAAIYGANSSGKSNLVSAIRFMSIFIRGSVREPSGEDNIDVKPFVLNAVTATRPSYFEIVLITNGQRYRYGFEVFADRIHSEWLYRVSKTTETQLFHRTESSIDTTASFSKESHGLRERTRRTSLFLSVVAAFNGRIAGSIVEWFAKLRVTTGLTDQYRQTTIQMLRDLDRRGPIDDFLSKLDLGFEQLIVPVRPQVTDLPDMMPEDQKRRTLASISQRIFTTHSVLDDEGKPVNVELFDSDEEESQGTRKLIALAGLIILALSQASVCVIDEIDARLHPLITRAIIRLFNSASTNPDGAQLIFVTHDTNLLDKAILRRDQIWFAEKDSFSSTHLTSLVEFKPRNDAAYEKHYLQGRYGAIPFIGDFSMLPEEMDAEAS